MARNSSQMRRLCTGYESVSQRTSSSDIIPVFLSVFTWSFFLTFRARSQKKNIIMAPKPKILFAILFLVFVSCALTVVAYLNHHSISLLIVSPSSVPGSSEDLAVDGPSVVINVFGMISSFRIYSTLMRLIRVMRKTYHHFKF